MMAVDMLATLINQRHLVRCFKNLERIDDKLAIEGVEINYKPLERMSLVLIMVTIFRNILMILFGYFAFQSNLFRLCTIYVPICVSVLSKIYFVLIVCNIRMKFDAINLYLDELANSLSALNQNHQRTMNVGVGSDSATGYDTTKSRSRSTNVNRQSTEQPVADFLPNEIYVKPRPKVFHILPAKNSAKPFDSREFIGSGVSGGGNNDELPSITRFVNDQIQFPANEFPPVRNGAIIIGDRFDKRLNNLCYLHDEICEIVSIANYMFSFQMLMLMAYGFLNITSQLYFVYCNLANQVRFLNDTLFKY